MNKEFKREIFMLVNLPTGGQKPVIAKYSDETMYNEMLAKFQQWERENKLHIIETREALYI